MHAARLDRLLHERRQRPGVADAGRAAVADDAEADRFQILQETGATQISLRRRRAWREGGLDPRLRPEAETTRLPREQARRDGEARIAGVGAARDRGDGDGAVRRLGRIMVAWPQRHIPEAGEGLDGLARRQTILRPARTGEAHADPAEVDARSCRCSAG